MSSRISALSLQNLYRRTHFNLNSVFNLNANLKYYSSVPNIKLTKNYENSSNIQYPKSILPLKNHSVDEILSNINEKSVSPEETVSLLKALRIHILFKNADSSSFKNNLKFEALCNVFEKKCTNLRPAMLVSGLRSLLEVGVCPNASCVICAEEHIIKNICLFSSSNIITCLYFHHKYTETDLQKKVVSVLGAELCRRVYEISTPSEILMLVHFLHLFKADKDLKLVQQRIIEVLPKLSSNELCKVLSTLSEYSNRNIYVLKAIIIHLQNKMDVKDMKDMKDALNILYSLKNLNYYDTKLLSHISAEVSAKIPGVTQPSVISGILTTCGYLKWKHPVIAEACGDWICNHLDSCRPKEFVSYILYVGAVNMKTSFTTEKVKAMIPYINREKTSPDVWLDIVWSMAVLSIVDKDILLQVLSPDFYNSLISGSDYHTITNKLKLLNLKAVLKIHHPECIFGCDLFLQTPQVPQSAEIESSRKYVIKVLSNFVPKDKYMCIGQNSDIGAYIDAEFIMDIHGKPLPLKEYGLLSKPTATKKLPEGYHRIALLILFYKDYTLYMDTVAGPYAIATHLLSAQGYTVVRISFEEFMKYSTEIKQAKYLLNEILKTLNGTMKNS